jgi:8-oxo-dGTP pyrophosphatase MutT (NUDIX family)
VKHYVLGFLTDVHAALLVRKEGRGPDGSGLNGVGGTVEPGESSIDAMLREFREETSILQPVAWRFVGTSTFQQGTILVDLYHGEMDFIPDVHGCRASQDEPVMQVYDLQDLYFGEPAAPCVPHVRTFLAACLERLPTPVNFTL